MTIGYKATHNYQCRDKIYKLGQEYKLEYDPVICDRGFHYCKNAKDVLNYYYYLSVFKLLEIEDLNPEESDHYYDKSCSNHIRIVREISDKDELMNLLQIERIENENENIEKFIYFNDDFQYTASFDLKNKIDLIERSAICSNSVFTEYTYFENGQFKSSKNNYGLYCIYTSKGWEQC